jgi:hypothetical protein
MAGDPAFDADKKTKSFPGISTGGTGFRAVVCRSGGYLRPSEYGNRKRTATMPLNFAGGITREPWSSMKSFQREQNGALLGGDEAVYSKRI